MVRVFRQAGYQVSRAYEDGVLHLEFDIDPTEQSEAVRDAREQRAEARSVHNLLHPRSVAVIGASLDPTRIGHAVFANLLQTGFTGPVYPVNPHVRSVRGVRAYASVTEIPDEVDLAVVAVPADDIDQVMDSCLAKGVSALLVLSSGFADAGGDGTVAQRRLVTEARAHGMRVVGPNALGVVNTDPGIRLNATLAPEVPGRGRVGFFAQSGALGIAILAAASERGLGLSTFVSAGNRADVSGNDLLQYWQTDAGTDVVLLYLETFGNPRKFSRLASRLARTKPVVAVKSGRHAAAGRRTRGRGRPGRRRRGRRAVRAGRRDPGGHALRAVRHRAAAVPPAAAGRVPGRRGGQLDRARRAGQRRAAGRGAGAGRRPDRRRCRRLPGAVRRRRPAGRRGPHRHRPVRHGPGRGAAAGPRHTRHPRHARHPAPGRRPDRRVRAPGGHPGRRLRPCPALRGRRRGQTGRRRVPGRRGGAGRARRPRSRRGPRPRLHPLLPQPGARRGRAGPRCTATPGGGPSRSASSSARPASTPSGPGHWWPASAPPSAAPSPTPRPWSCSACYGIPITEYRLVEGVEAALAAAAELGYPVAVKAVGDRWQHRADLVGVRLDIVTETGVRRAHAELSELTGQDAVYVQRMAPKGVSCVLEVTRRPVLRVAAVLRALRDGHRAARRPGLPGRAGVRHGRRSAGPVGPGDTAADRLPGQRTGPPGRPRGPGAAARTDGRGPARAARAQRWTRCSPRPRARSSPGPGWCSARRPRGPTPGPRRLR